ncbi:MAG: hypothetical protein M1450_03115 [Patescibacteria group bacterium]|nr:hypothetical protein [Patescibacteria group bacterium]
MTNNNGSHCGGGNKFLTGLMWGAIIGGGLVFLLGTKKGKKIIKMLSEEGIELSELLGEGQEEEEEIIVTSKKSHGKKPVNEIAEEDPAEEDIEETEKTPKTNGFKHTTAISKIVTSPRRFFKGAPKR